MGAAKKIVLLTILVAIMAGTASLVVPTPAGKAWVSFHFYLGLSLVAAVLYLGGSWLSIKGLGGFTKELKRAYILMCLGFSLFGLSQVELPVLIALDKIQSFWRESGIIALPFVGALVCIYAGSRFFARLFNLKDFSTAIWFEVIGALVLMGGFALLPHAAPTTTELAYDASASATVWNFFTAALCTVYMLRVRRIASVMYTNAVAWLSLTFGVIAFTGGSYLIAITFLGDGHTEIISTLSLVPLALAAVLLLRSAYAFNLAGVSADTAEKSVARTFFGKPRALQLQQTTTSIDIVTFTANMASDARSIDTLLDGVREITSTLKQSQVLSDIEQQKLMDIYLQIEQYLVEKEPVRSFTKDVLRQHIAQKLELTSGDSRTFWNRLPATQVTPTAPATELTPNTAQV